MSGLFDTPDYLECEDCGAAHHLFSWECPYNLHGKDTFKSSCAICETAIPSGAPRKGDQFGNLYCSTDCELAGKDELLDIAMAAHREVTARV